MSMLRSRNPAMSVFEQARDERLTHDDALARGKVMTLNGTVTATAILLSIVATVAMLVYAPLAKSITAAASGQSFAIPVWIWPALIGSLIGGLVLSLIIAFKPKTSPFIAPIHAAMEGVFVGVVSVLIPMQFLGAASVSLVIQAMLATLAITAGMLIGYATGVLRVGAFMRKVIITATMGLMIYALALILLRFVGINMWNGYADTGIFGIGFTGLCVILASLFLLLDFQYIEAGIANRAPKYMEWVGAWGLMVTLVWLYIEVLRLLAKLQSRD
ncbi:MAG: Bax inhibitor-1/YccA family protein [Phycisphaerales bacterium]|nr:Bax inhibitor-1/YccA family protein [Phycisphaerales bacterium]